MRRDLPTGTVTFLFTDIEGSTRLLHALGPDAYAEALAEHRRVLRDVLRRTERGRGRHSGRRLLHRVPDAPRERRQPPSKPSKGWPRGPLPSGWDSTRGHRRSRAEGYVGVDVHRGARVGALAHGGQIVLSPATAALLDGHELRDLGLHRLKDFDTAIRLSQLDSAEFPPLRTRGSVELPVPRDSIHRTRG